MQATAAPGPVAAAPAIDHGKHVSDPAGDGGVGGGSEGSDRKRRGGVIGSSIVAGHKRGRVGWG